MANVCKPGSAEACKTDKPASAFPPTEDAFKQHVLRFTIWVHSDQAKPVLWSPAGNGWKMDDAELQPVFYEKDAAPVEVRDPTHDMNCADADCNDAHCLHTSFQCTEYCACNGHDCGTKQKSAVVTDDSSDSNDD
jgi:hypothetical protein